MRVIDLGADVAYVDGLACMRATMERIDDDGPALILIEHRPTITITRRGGTHAFVSPRALIEADRGGDVTFHGPGQLTAYPILRLGPTSLGCDVVGYVRALEAAIVDVVVALGVPSARSIEGRDHEGHFLTGVWCDAVGDETTGCNSSPPGDEHVDNSPTRAALSVNSSPPGDEHVDNSPTREALSVNSIAALAFGPQAASSGLRARSHAVEMRRAKLAAIGVGLGGGVTRHGFALNVSTHLEHYTRHIVPCGLQESVTSLERLLARTPSMREVKARVVDVAAPQLQGWHRRL